MVLEQNEMASNRRISGFPIVGPKPKNNEVAIFKGKLHGFVFEKTQKDSHSAYSIYKIPISNKIPNDNEVMIYNKKTNKIEWIPVNKESGNATSIIGFTIKNKGQKNWDTIYWSQDHKEWEILSVRPTQNLPHSYKRGINEDWTITNKISTKNSLNFTLPKNNGQTHVIFTGYLEVAERVQSTISITNDTMTTAYKDWKVIPANDAHLATVNIETYLLNDGKTYTISAYTDGKTQIIKTNSNIELKEIY